MPFDIRSVLQGLAGGMMGDPTWAFKMQQAKQLLQMKMEEATQEKEKNKIMADYHKALIARMDFEEKYKKEERERQEQPISKSWLGEEPTMEVPEPTQGPPSQISEPSWIKESALGPSGEVTGTQMVQGEPTTREVPPPMGTKTVPTGEPRQIDWGKVKGQDLASALKYAEVVRKAEEYTLTPGAKRFKGGKEIAVNPKEPTAKNATPEFTTEQGTKVYIDQIDGKRYVAGQNGWEQYDVAKHGKPVIRNPKGYDTWQEAFAESQRMVEVSGKDAGLVPSFDLTTDNKYIPKVQPNITVRIPPFTQGQNLPPGIVFNRKTGKYSDTTTGKEFDRQELVNQYGVYAAINADKMALGELTKREQLIKVFTNRIDANVPIVLDAVRDVKNTNARLYNQAINTGKQYLIGSGKWTALQTAMQSLSNEVQRVETGQLGIGGQGTEDRKIWAKFHDPNMSFKDIEEVCNMITKLSKTAVKVIEEQRTDLINRIPEEGYRSSPIPTTQPQPGLQLIPGKSYKDAQGNVKTFNGYNQQGKPQWQ